MRVGEMGDSEGHSRVRIRAGGRGRYVGRQRGEKAMTPPGKSARRQRRCGERVIRTGLPDDAADDARRAPGRRLRRGKGPGAAGAARLYAGLALSGGGVEGGENLRTCASAARWPRRPASRSRGRCNCTGCSTTSTCRRATISRSISDARVQGDGRARARPRNRRRALLPPRRLARRDDAGAHGRGWRKSLRARRFRRCGERRTPFRQPPPAC